MRVVVSLVLCGFDDPFLPDAVYLIRFKQPRTHTIHNLIGLACRSFGRQMDALSFLFDGQDVVRINFVFGTSLRSRYGDDANNLNASLSRKSPDK